MNAMDYYAVSPALLVAIIAMVAIVLAVFAYALVRSRRHHRDDLRVAFGPEYDYALEHYRNPRRAERELLRRQKRVQKLHIRPLSSDEYNRYAYAWAESQKRFVDDPVAAIRDADRLVKDVMQTRGYPVVDFDQRIADLSVDHGTVIQHYRAARALASANEQGRASTEELRQALIHYRALFADLLQTEVGQA
jgi:hypothetical protein